MRWSGNTARLGDHTNAYKTSESLKKNTSSWEKQDTSAKNLFPLDEPALKSPRTESESTALKARVQKP
jgi:hypothetical protein